MALTQAETALTQASQPSALKNFMGTPAGLATSVGITGLGGLLSGLFGGGGLMGHSAKVKQYPMYTPGNVQALDWLTQQGMQNADLGAIQDRELSRFHQDIIPSLAEQFSAMGGQGSLGSSGFHHSLGLASGDLAERLGALRANYGMQQLGMGIRPQFENMMTPRRPGGLEQAFGSIASLLPLLAKL